MLPQFLDMSEISCGICRPGSYNLLTIKSSKKVAKKFKLTFPYKLELNTFQ